MFARTMVNRVWANFMGRGLVDPVDDLRATNPASNEELLAALSKDFVEHGYDVQRLIRTIMNSSVYQLSSEANATNQSDNIYYSKHIVRRLPAEVILDAMSQVTGAPDGVRRLSRRDARAAIARYAGEVGVPDVVRPAARAISAMPPSGRAIPTIAQALHVINGDTLNKKLSAPDGTIALFLKLGCRTGASLSTCSFPRSAAIRAMPSGRQLLDVAGEQAQGRAKSPRRASAGAGGHGLGHAHQQGVSVQPLICACIALAAVPSRAEPQIYLHGVAAGRAPCRARRI